VGRVLSVTVLLLAGLCDPIEAQNQTGDADALARELSNPVGSLASLVFQGTYNVWGGSLEGAEDQSSSALVFLPTLPFQVWGGNLIVRPSLAVSGVPFIDGVGEWDKKRGLGDVVLLVNWGRKEDSGLLWSVGGVGVLPTATDDLLGADQWQAGPAAILGLLKPWGVLGGLWQHYFGLNEPDDGDEKVNKGTLQIFYWFSLPGGWQVGGSPVTTANYVQAQDIDFSLPLNLGVAKTVMAGDTPLKMTVQGQYFVTRPETLGPSWGVFFQITPVVNVPW
jgi:hypothetical protein